MQALDILKNNKHIGIDVESRTYVLVDANDAVLLNKFSNYKSNFELAIDSPNRMESYVNELNPLAYDIVEFSEKPIVITTSSPKNVSELALFETNKIQIRNVRSGSLQDIIRKYRMPLILFLLDDKDNHLLDTKNTISLEMQDAFMEASIIQLESNGRVNVIRK